MRAPCQVLMVFIPIVSIVLALLSPGWLLTLSQRHPEVEGAPRILNGVKDEELIRHETQDINQLMGRPIHEFQLSDILVATDIEGGLHALNRETGEVVWSLEVDEPLVSVQSNFSQDGKTSTDDSIVWIVEPYGDGNLYMFNKEIGLTKLPVSISQLVLQSPFALNGDDKVYTGLRKSSLYTIDIATGEIVTTYGATSNFKTDYCSGDKEDCSTVVVLGKTSYELTIHSKDNTYWNVTYSTWGPNNIDIDLAMQNKIPLDGTYIAPFHDSTILAIDVNSKIAKWVSQLPYTVVNVFDILRDSRENLEGKSFIVVPHPLKPPEGFSGVQNEGTYLDMTLNRSWYAMSSEYYPSLVQSAPASRYSMSERWRSPQILNSPQYFNAAIIGVHQPSSSETGFDFDPTGAIAGYPTNFPQHYPNHQAYNTETPRTNEVGIYQPPSRSEWLSLPSSSTPVLQIDPSPMGKKGFFDTAFGNFLYRCLENLVMIAILSLVLYVAVKLEWLPSLNVLLRNNGLELKELESPVFEAPKSARVQEELQSEKNHSLKPVPKIHEEASPSPDDETNQETDDPPNIGSELRKEVTIVEPPLEERVSHENSGTGLKKRKRGSRGGKKSKKNQEAKDAPQHSPSNSSSNNEIVSAGDQSTDKLSLTDEVLGYGSYGTVVFKGVFQGRDVAVKRMLIDFYDVASHEIGLLTESDDHPNVIRYFYNETNDKFLFIALELCSASLEDVIEKSLDFPDLVRQMEPVNVLEQIAKGLHHLHSLKIVHRDIKPQNILVAPPKKLKTRQESFTPVRILISDFGLCKRLEADESSFRATTQHAAGTSGWRAPELLVDEGSYSFSSISMSSDHSFNTSSNSIAEPLVFDTLSKRRLTRAIDIFSLGCLFYYILTNGGHPFGDRYLREGNVIKGQYNLDLLDILPENVVEAKDLISKMISRNPKLRPNTDQVLKHPFFWSNTKKLDFLLKVSDRYEVERRDPPSEMLQQLETIATAVIGDDWTVKFEKIFMDNLGKYRKYHGDRVMDLLRALRNKYHHFNDLPVDLAGKMGPLPDGFYRYFNSKFPRLLMEIYGVVEKNLIDDHVLGTFF